MGSLIHKWNCPTLQCIFIFYDCKNKKKKQKKKQDLSQDKVARLNFERVRIWKISKPLTSGGLTL